jgi:hypothetical protein
MFRTVIIDRGGDLVVLLLLRLLQDPGSEPVGPEPLYCRWPRFFTILLGAACALRTLRVARDLRRCELDYRRWG